MCSELLAFLCHYWLCVTKQQKLINALFYLLLWNIHFIQLASSSLLKIGQETDKTTTRNRESVYLLLDMVSICVFYLQPTNQWKSFLCWWSWHSTLSIFFSFPQHAHIIAIILYCLEHCISHCSDNFPCSLSTYHTFKKQCSECVGENPLCSKDFLSVFSIFQKMTIYIGKRKTCFEKQ